MGIKQEFLGDGLYVSFDGFQYCLMANSHIEPTDKVYLDPHTLESFKKFIARCETEENSEQQGEI